MGSRHSGRYGQRSRRVRAEQQLVLNIGTLHKGGLLDSGRDGFVAWERQGSLVFLVHSQDRFGNIRLSYCLPDSHKARSIHREQALDISWSDCNFGGKRPWFICSNDLCGRRAGKLYLNTEGDFVCRCCARIVYECQYECGEDSALRKAEKLRKLLNWPPGLIKAAGGKPAGMHQQTYWKHLVQYSVLLRQAFLALV